MVSLLAHAGTVSPSISKSAWSAPPLRVGRRGRRRAALFTQGFVRLRRRGRADHAPWSRAILFGLGLGIGVLALISPLDAAADQYLLSTHMLPARPDRRSGAAPDRARAARRALFFLLPAVVLRALSPIGALRAALAFLLIPWVSLALWTVVILGWHILRLYDATLSHPALHELEHAMFVLVGVLIWTQMIDPARHGRLTRGGRILFGSGCSRSRAPSDRRDGLRPRALRAVRGAAPPAVRAVAADRPADRRLIMFVEQTLTVGAAIGVLLGPISRCGGGRFPEAKAA